MIQRSCRLDSVVALSDSGGAYVALALAHGPALREVLSSCSEPSA